MAADGGKSTWKQILLIVALLPFMMPAMFLLLAAAILSLPLALGWTLYSGSVPSARSQCPDPLSIVYAMFLGAGLSVLSFASRWNAEQAGPLALLALVSLGMGVWTLATRRKRKPALGLGVGLLYAALGLGLGVLLTLVPLGFYTVSHQPAPPGPLELEVPDTPRG